MFYIRKLSHFFSRKILCRNYQVTIVGGACEIGQTVGLLLKTESAISNLIIHDNLEHTPGIVLDLSHVPTKTKIKGYFGEDSLERALKNSELVIATGGFTQRPGLSPTDTFNLNANFIKTLAAKVAKISPLPFIGIATEPINILVPMAAEIMRNNGEYNPKKVFGITSTDVLRAQCLYATENNICPLSCSVPVIGGHSNETIIPLLSQADPKHRFNEQQIIEITTVFRNQEEFITNIKGGWSPTLCIAYGIVTFVQGILNALDGRPTQIHAFVENNDFGTRYFSGFLNVDKNGAGEMKRYNNLSKYELQLLEHSIKQIRKDVTRSKKMLEFA